MAGALFTAKADPSPTPDIESMCAVRPSLHDVQNSNTWTARCLLRSGRHDVTMPCVGKTHKTSCACDTLEEVPSAPLDL